MDSSHWRAWHTFCNIHGQDPLLSSFQGTSPLERKQLFLAFAQWLREGGSNNGRQARGSQIENTLRHCAQVFDSLGHQDPRRSSVNQKLLDKDFSTLQRKYKEADPPPKSQLALPAKLFRWVSEDYRSMHTAHPNILSLADLIVLAFFFLFRVGEYICASPGTQQKRRTIPLRKKDIQLWRGDTKIALEAPLNLMLTADKVSMSLENQKNGARGQMITHSSTGCPNFCPVKAAIRRLHHLRACPDDTPLCSYIDNQGNLLQLRARAVKPVLQAAALINGFMPDKGYQQDQIGSHSIRASGAMALKLQGQDDTMIQLLGRWSSNTFQRYIRPQISNLTAGLSSIMSNNLHFSYTH
jgi:hypothetical protein